MSHPIDTGARTIIPATASNGTNSKELVALVAGKRHFVAGLEMSNTHGSTAFTVSLMSAATVIGEFLIPAKTCIVIGGRERRLETEPGEALNFKIDAGTTEVRISGEAVTK